MENELEKLANMRAKNRAHSWSEQVNSVWNWLSVMFGLLAFYGLLITWVGWSNGELNVGVPVIVTLAIAALGWFLYRKSVAWMEKRFRELYEEELLQLKLKK